MHSSRTSRSGYGLIVIAALFTAFAVIAAAAIDRNSVSGELSRQQLLQAQMSRLSVALAKYAKYNSGLFPCPASYLELPSSSTFGAPAATNCYTGTGAAPAGTALSGSVISGMVPVRPLIAYGVSFNDAFDPWGSRIMYNVHRDVTTGGTASSATDATRPTVTEYITQQAVTPPPDFVLVSYGRDRIGGRLRNQASLASPSIACGSTDRRYLNCDGDINFTSGPLLTSTQAASTAYFDDTVSAYRYNGVAAGCGGTLYATYCWYYGAVNTPCNTVCATHGGVNAATTTYVGSGGSQANCQAVQTALGTGYTSSFSNNAYAYGCVRRNSPAFLYWYNLAPTDYSATNTMWQHVCACNN